MNLTYRPFNILSTAGRDKGHLQQVIEETIAFISQTRDSLHDICYTANIHGNTLKHRLAVVGKSKEDIVKKLKNINRQAAEEQAEVYRGGNAFTGKIAFLFTGQGSLYPGMGKELYHSAPVFKESMQKCDELFSNHIHQSITRLLYSTDNNGKQLNRAMYSQPIIFSIGYSLNRLWESWGIEPAVVIGHSIGEYAAACAAGVFSLEEAVKLVATRGNIMEQVPDNGKMVGVLMSEARAREIIAPYAGSVSIAAVNTPQNVTLSGDRESLEKIIREIKQERLFVEHLDISHPFHSIRMVPYVEKFKEALRGLSFSRPSIPIISAITGQMAEDEMSGVDYWSTHIANTVRFCDAVKTAESRGVRAFVEIGGTAVLSGLAADCMENKDALFLPSLRKGNRPWRQLCNSLAQLYTAGIHVNWEQFHQADKKPRVILPDAPLTPMDTPAKTAPQVEKTGEAKPRTIETLKTTIKHMLEIIAGLDPESIEENASLFSLGIDSLMLVQLRKKIDDKYRVDITVNDFFTTYTTLKKITDVIVERMPREEPVPGAVPAPAPPAPAPEPRETPVEINMPPPTAFSLNPGSHDRVNYGGVDGIIARQLELMNRQHQKMAEIMEKQSSIIEKQISVLGKSPVSGSPLPHTPQEKEKPSIPPQPRPSMPIFRFNKMEKDDLTAEQQTFIADFIARYNARTSKSKAYAQAHRRELSDWLNAVNFRMSIKELIYPIVSQRSEGARMWDIDGNEYIDLSMGFGVNYFGHRPPFLVKALEKKINTGLELATQSNLAGEVARLICKLGNVERVVFSNTGTEAVMGAVRVARAVTARKKVVRFAGSFHGSFDGILAEAQGNNTYPASLGTPQSVVEDIIVLPYGSAESLEKIKNLGQELAAVLVEPVQSRRPGYHPRGFLQQLREITTQIGAAFILDDIYMGFRIHQGGSQAYFGIEADIVTYGKVIGGGMPIGIIAGKAKFLDAVDGGYWQYGDASIPPVQTVFFSGTFCRHPLAMAAAYAALKHMETQGPQLQEQVNQIARHLVDSVNRFFEQEHVPVRIRIFGSLFRFESFGAYDLAFNPIEMDLMFHLLINKGIYIWERRVCCLSTAHTHEDMEFVINAIKETISELRQGGFTFSAVPRGENPGKPGNKYPLTPGQQRFFVLNQVKELERAGHLVITMIVKDRLDLGKLETAMLEIIERHEVFRVGFRLQGVEIHQEIHEPGETEFSLTVKKFPGNNLDMNEAIEGFIRPFDLGKPPLIRLCAAEFSPEHFLLVLDMHHIVSDGDTADIVIKELTRLYRGDSLPPLELSFRDHEAGREAYLKSPTFKTQEQYWRQKFSNPFPKLQLPADFPRPAKKDYKGGMVSFRIHEKTTLELKQAAKNSETTLFMTLLASYCILLYHLSGQQQIAVGIPVSLRNEKGAENFAGFNTNNLVYLGETNEKQTFADYLNQLKKQWFDMYLHKEYPYETLVEHLDIEKDISRNPLFDVMFIYENVNERVFKPGEITVTLYYPDLKISIFDLILEVSQQGNLLDIKFYYNTGLFKKETIEKWKGYFERLLVEILSKPDILIGDILKEVKPGKRTAINKVRQNRTLPQKQEERSRDKKKSNHQPPVNEIEKKIIEIWEQELNLQEIGVRHDFFELGGRSFDTVRTISEINRRFGTRVSLAAIFASPTVAELALEVEKALETETRDNTAKKKQTIPKAPPRSIYELSHGQMRYWANVLNASRQGELETTGKEITGEVIILEGNLDHRLLKQAVVELFKRHHILRTIYTEQQGKPGQIILPEIPGNRETGIPFEYIDLYADGRGSEEQRYKKLTEGLIKEYNWKFKLNKWPLMRLTLYKIEESRYILCINTPHINLDGWSYTIILEEMAFFYNTLKAGAGRPSLPPVPQYVDYTEWNKQRLESGELEQQASYWTDYLNRQIPVAHLHYDYPDKEAITYADLESPKVYQFALDPRLTEKIKEMASTGDTTLFIVAMAILQTWIAVIANQTHVTVGTIFSGRTYPELEKIPGIMMNLMPIRLDLSGNPDCRQILDRTKTAILTTYNNQDFPLDLVAHKMRKVIDFNRDIYSIAFIGQESLGKIVRFDGIKISTRPFVNLISAQTDENDVFIPADYNIRQDLLIEMFEETHGIKFLVRYNRRRFRSQTIKKYFDHFKLTAGTFTDPQNPRLSQMQSFKMDLDELF